MSSGENVLFRDQHSGAQIFRAIPVVIAESCQPRPRSYSKERGFHRFASGFNSVLPFGAGVPPTMRNSGFAGISPQRLGTIFGKINSTDPGEMSDCRKSISGPGAGSAVE